MRTQRKQAGLGLLGLLIIATMVGFFVMSGIRILPGYFEYLAVRDILISVAEEYNRDEDTLADIRRKLGNYMNTNQIKSIQPKEVELERREGEVVIIGNYEQRIPLLWRIDAVVKYDDLEFVAGESYRD